VFGMDRLAGGGRRGQGGHENEKPLELPH
jgi:hypothetical protein